MTSSEPEREKIQQQKEYGDSATAVTPDTQQRAQGEPVNNDEDDDGLGGDEPHAQGPDEDTPGDGPDAESGFYG